MAQRFDLDLDRKIKDLSKGNQQKIGVIQTFMHKPSVLILDEPTSGLDPIVQREFSALVDENQSRGAAILLFLHVLSEVEHLADRVVIPMAMPLFLKTLRDQHRGFLGWRIGAVAIISIQLSVFPTVRSSAEGLNTFIENYPEALQKIFRMEDYTSGTGYLSTELFSFMLPLVFIAVGAAWGANAIAQEEERRTVDVLLTLPISRTRVLVTKILSALTAQITLALVIFFTIFVGIRFVDISITPSKILVASFSCSLLDIVFNAVATLFGSIFGKKSIALGGAITLAIAGFLFYSLAPLVHTFDRALEINPFQWALGKNSLITGLDFVYTTRSILTALVIYSASLLTLRSRDILAKQ